MYSGIISECVRFHHIPFYCHSGLLRWGQIRWPSFIKTFDCDGSWFWVWIDKRTIWNHQQFFLSSTFLRKAYIGDSEKILSHSSFITANFGFCSGHRITLVSKNICKRENEKGFECCLQVILKNTFDFPIWILHYKAIATRVSSSIRPSSTLNSKTI